MQATRRSFMSMMGLTAASGAAVRPAALASTVSKSLGLGGIGASLNQVASLDDAEVDEFSKASICGDEDNAFTQAMKNAKRYIKRKVFYRAPERFVIESHQRSIKMISPGINELRSVSNVNKYQMSQREQYRRYLYLEEREVEMQAKGKWLLEDQDRW